MPGWYCLCSFKENVSIHKFFEIYGVPLYKLTGKQGPDRVSGANGLKLFDRSTLVLIIFHTKHEYPMFDMLAPAHVVLQIKGLLYP